MSGVVHFAYPGTYLKELHEYCCPCGEEADKEHATRVKSRVTCPKCKEFLSRRDRLVISNVPVRSLPKERIAL